MDHGMEQSGEKPAQHDKATALLVIVRLWGEYPSLHGLVNADARNAAGEEIHIGSEESTSRYVVERL